MTEDTSRHLLNDDEDVFALVHLNELLVRLDLCNLERHAMTIAVPRNAQERHVREYGHRLRFGCCAKRDPEVASDAAGV
jgi:hypothetical protein